MQRYIYGNIGHAGYRTVSSAPEYFRKNESKMESMRKYDSASAHGNLAPGEYRYFLMLTADLKDKISGDFLFLQEVGQEPHRNGTVVQGYRSDPGDGEMYDSRFLKLLDTSFGPIQEACLEVETNAQLAPVAAEKLPCFPNPIAPKMLQQDLLEHILLTVLQGRKKVVLQIPETGTAAMMSSRGYLKAIYQRLPYELRKRNGCMTGATVALIDEIKVIKIVLADADADLSEIRDDIEIEFFNLCGGNGAWVEKPWKESIKSPSEIKLISFLATETPEKLDSFFSFCQDALNMEGGTIVSGWEKSIRKYSDLLAAYRLVQKDLAGSDIQDWAVRLYDVNWPKNLRDRILKIIASRLTSENLSSYLKDKMPAYTDLKNFGMLTEEDKAKKSSDSRDQNAALTLQMVRQLPGFDCSAVWKALEVHFVSLAKAQIPCAEIPTKATLRQLDSLWLPEPGEDAYVDQLKNAVRGELEQFRNMVKERYWQERHQQDEDGRKQIRVWHSAPSDFLLEPLYQELRQYRLYEDLIGDWNVEIAGRITEVCQHYEDPKTLDGYDGQINELQQLQNCFGAYGGVFTPEQAKIMENKQKDLQRVRNLCGQKPQTAQEWEKWFSQVRSERMDLSLQEKVVKGVSRDFLEIIPDGLPLREVERRLECCERYAEWLDSNGVVFEPWAIRLPPAQIRNRLQKLKGYQLGAPEPALNDRVCNWAKNQLPQNKSLMILIIREQYQQREALLGLLSEQRGIEFEPGDIRQLYLSGCSRKMLEKTLAGGLSLEDFPTGSWRNAVEEFLNEEASKPLPDPVHIKPPKYVVQNVLLGIQLFLIAAAVLLPAVACVLRHTKLPIWCGIFEGAMAVISICSSFLQKKKAPKVFLLALAAVLLLGTVVSVAISLLL